ncbi:Transmembrane domain-containing protein [Spironucleus salmonicida]|uniref:Transmembrane domain-containing protein n=1 Tax=Spironucleus salmonicida TaxID=348837 RepID=V6LI16_9EUKA|nr:Transmembrane domain-containing protein [Spironucleus salmonicida]|eukprot:EST43963.1 Transmembrane domain-containing protein [Spironucleus salmonicida]
MTEQIQIHTFHKVEQNNQETVLSLGNDPIQTSNQYGLSMRDFRQLLVDVSLIEPRNNVIIASLGPLNCIFTQQHAHILVSLASARFIQFFKQIFNQTDQFKDFELRCLEALLIFVVETLEQQLKDIEKAFEVQQSHSKLAQTRKSITQLLNDTSRALDALDQLIDSNQDVLALSFQNQQFLPRFSSQLAPEFDYQIKFLNENKNIDDFQNMFKISLQQLLQFLENFIFQLESVKTSADQLESYIHASFDVLNLHLNSQQNQILKISVFSEITAAAIAIPNLLFIIFGQNFVNPWCADPQGVLYMDGDGPAIFIGIVGGILCFVYIFVCWNLFKRGLRKYS